MVLLNLVLKKIESALHYFILLLPHSPFRAFMGEFQKLPYLEYINYFIPIGSIIAITQAWAMAIGVYYVYSVVLRWLKAIE